MKNLHFLTARLDFSFIKSIFHRTIYTIFRMFGGVDIFHCFVNTQKSG